MMFVLKVWECWGDTWNCNFRDNLMLYIPNDPTTESVWQRGMVGGEGGDDSVEWLVMMVVMVMIVIEWNGWW